MAFEETKRKIQRAIAAAKKNRRQLDLSKLRERLRDAKSQRNRKQRAIKEGIEHKEKLLDRLRSTPDSEVKKLNALEEDIAHADKHLEMLHTVVSRRTQLIRRLKPKNRARTKQRKDLKKRIHQRQRKLRKLIRKHHNEQPPSTGGVGYFDGKPVAAWIVPILASARRNGWSGTLTSGYRSAAYSTGLCYSICGAPTCPGRCAGATSNHTHLDSTAAVDVSDPYGFARAQSQLRNALGAADPWHYSRSGG